MRHSPQWATVSAPSSWPGWVRRSACDSLRLDLRARDVTVASSLAMSDAAYPG